MKHRPWVLLSGLFIVSGLLWAAGQSSRNAQERLVRLAEIEIDPSQLERYKAALREEIETSIRIEPGVLALYAVSVKDHPEQIRLFEMYASQRAYEAHLETPHFKKYKTETQGMIQSLRLLETTPVVLGSKGV